MKTSFLSILFLSFFFSNLAFSSAASSNLNFTMKLMSEIQKKEKKNFMISPYSINQALWLAAEGSAGATKTEFDQILSPVSELKLGKDIEWNNVNRLWGNQEFQFAKTYLATLKNKHQADAVSLNFKADPTGSRSKINEWVAHNTKEKIKNLIPDNVIKPQTLSILTNAAYFKGPWQHQFEVSATTSGDFQLDSGKKIQTKFMKQSERVAYGENEFMQWISLPYGNDQSASFVVLLPKKGQSITKIQQQFSDEMLENMIGSPWQMTHIDIPKFKFEFQQNLENHLQMMGLKSAFNEKSAQFSKMLDPLPKDPIFISNVIHKTFIDVNEKGTEAAAATAVMMMVGSAMSPNKPAVFKADHPFLFMIVTGTVPRQILFAGQLVEPTGN